VTATSTLVLDIETIRDPRMWTPPPDDPDAFAPPYAHQVICVGCVLLEHGPRDEYARTVRVGVLEGAPELSADEREREVLGQFARFVGERRPDVATWNGRRFDLPTLMLRSMRLGICHAWYYSAQGMRYRYTEQGHCDLGDCMADYGAAPSLGLDGMSRLIGLPGKFGDIDGATVGQAYADGRIREIGSYCLADAAQTACLWLRWQHLTGRMRLDVYQRSVDELLQHLVASGRADELVAHVDRRVLFLQSAETP
jgi:predicted PolB exonuclease-like 3'-5' exonuclease